MVFQFLWPILWEMSGECLALFHVTIWPFQPQMLAPPGSIVYSIDQEARAYGDGQT